MDHPPPPPSNTTTTKLRLMCSYNGHILPRPNSKTLSYLGGETRIVAVDRRTTTTLSSLLSHLSKTLLYNRPFVLKYQLPNEDLDSLISVLTDEDLLNMLEEHDRIAPPARIRLFLFPVVAKFDQENYKFSSGPESLVLERSSSFGSTGSSFSTSNSPPVGVLERNVRVPSSASIDSEYSTSSFVFPPRSPIFQEPLIQLGPEPPSTVSEPNIPMQSTFEMLQYPIPQLSDVTKLSQDGLQYTPQYMGPPYYSVYQMPIQTYPPPNQPYPVYLVPAMPPQYLQNMSLQSVDNVITTSASCPPLPLQIGVMTQPIVQKELFGDSTIDIYTNVSSATSSLLSAASDRGYYHLVTDGSENVCVQSEPVTFAQMGNSVQGNEFDEDIAYNPIYKTQPSAPTVSSQ